VTQAVSDRLNDPLEHYPYKHAEATALREENPPAGQRGPDDDSVMISDYISHPIIDASAAMVEAQKKMLLDPESSDAYRAYKASQEELVDARRRHRANRGAGPNIVAIRGAE
jgi:hypothetical protein